MKFQLIDRIEQLTSGQQIVAVKAVSLAEEYLADHFPTFAVLPGVLMLEVMVEAAGWLVKEALDFKPAVILLKEAKNVTYKSFVRPGQLLRVTISCRELGRTASTFDGLGTCEGREVVKGRFTVAQFAAGDRQGLSAEVSESLACESRASLTRLIA